MAIDSVVWTVLVFVAVYAVAAVTGDIEVGAAGVDATLEGTPGMVALGLWLALAIGYHTVLEWRFGRTVGKSLVKIRVVDEGGTAPSLSASLGRNLLRLVDWLPALYLVGIVAVVASDRSQRLGDRLAGTAVVRA